MTTREVRAKEILMVEEGFRYPNHAHLYIICSHCIKSTANGIPCESCVLIAMYCPEDCKNEAWKSYHEKECTVLDYNTILKKNHHRLLIITICTPK